MIPKNIASIFIQITTQFSGEIISIDAGNFIKNEFSVKDSIYKTCPFLQGTLEAIEENRSFLLEGMLIVSNGVEYNVDVELQKQINNVTVLVHNRASVYKFVNQLNQNRNDLFFLKREIDEKNKELEELRKIADKANEQKTRFLAMMSHEVRNPLNVILGYSKMISEEDINAKVKEYSKLLSLSGEHLKVIVNDILDLSRIEAGKLSLESKPIQIAEIVKNCFENYTHQNKKDTVRLVLSNHTELPKLVLGDDVRLNQVLSNLLSNALKFTEKGEIKIDVKVVKETDEKIYIGFLVSDSGRGMMDVQVSKIFDEYTQNKKSDNRVFGGAGLGLSIVKRLLKAMDGKITVNSKLNVGTTFTVTIPFLKVKSKKNEHKNTITNQLTKGVDLNGKRILVADDDALNQTIVAHILKKEKVDFTLVKDGLEALNILKKEAFDIVLLDIHMPNITGEQLVQKKYEFFKDNSTIPFLALTANTAKEDIERYIKIGFNSVIGKPYTAADFIKTIKTTLS
ncbi:ATP-binding protein [uncultured Polaribacter sp.]|uniref:ATP-binding response regulator n=1 Tax=uncultured Polaribacter sp. TaxID=174711 RepID=UPI00260C3B99|nr:ATP-binding protein [uncultured Polaribacter sp.]